MCCYHQAASALQSIRYQTHDNRTDYVSYDSHGKQILQTIVRDNCTAGSYCNYKQSHMCISAKAVGEPCIQDNECMTDNCIDLSNTCGLAADSFNKVPVLVWIILSISIFLFVSVTLLLLWFLHRYQSNREHEKACRFFEHANRFCKLAVDDEKLNTKEISPSTSTSRASGMIYLATPGSFMQTNPHTSTMSQSLTQLAM